MSRVLVTHTYFMRFDPKQWGLQQAYPPLGSLYAAAVLRKEGHEVSFFDVMFLEDAGLINSALDREVPDILVICDDGFNYLTKMCLTNMREAGLSMIAEARKRNCRIIISSSDASDHASLYLERGADFVIHGETEVTLMELVRAVSTKSGDFSGIRGISYLSENKIHFTGARQVMENPDELPFPAWDLVDMQQYRSMWIRAYGSFSINLATTRGCPYRCTWCAKPIYGYRYSSHSPEYIIEQLLYLKSEYDFQSVWFCDDIFGLDRKWVARFAELVAAHKLSFRYKIQSRADLLLNEDYVRDLARSGCETIWMGTESGSQKVLDAMNKGLTTSQIEAATKLLKVHGIRPAFFIQFGYPGETADDIGMTLKMINRLLPEDIGISISYPLPGTVFYEQVKSELKEKSNWTDSDELALMFRNTYPPAFYKRLHRYTHKSYRLHQAWHCFVSFLKSPGMLNFNGLRRIVLIPWYLIASMYCRLRLNFHANG